MQHIDHNLAEICLEELRDGRARCLSADAVQAIANRMGYDERVFRPAGDSNVAAARAEAYRLTCRLAERMKNNEPATDNAWKVAILQTREWLEATESRQT